MYKLPKDSPISRVGPARKQNEMGKISNLISDMTIRGASTEERARAVRHSMVVIDSEKHELNLKQSEIDNGIAALKEEYQGRIVQGRKKTGSSTLISLAGSPIHIPQRRPRSMGKGGPIDRVTGKKVFEPTDRMVPKLKRVKDLDTGNMKTVQIDVLVPKLEKHKRLAITEDASTLSSGTTIENIYADHSNKLKALANTARKEAIQLKGTPYSPSAKAVYKNEVATLTAKVNTAQKNTPLERQAQLLAQARLAQTRQANPGMDKDEVKKIKQIALTDARIRTGAKKYPVVITQPEWDAIQAGAISKDKLEKILKNTDIDVVKRLALPRTALTMTSSKKAQANAMLKLGYTQSEVADHLGVGLTTLKVSLGE
jgi:hypothetical protein